MTPQPTPTNNTTNINTAWNLLHAAITQRRTIRARYHDHLRILSPHAIGWKNGRPKTLVYQTALIDPPPTHDPRGWRSLIRRRNPRRHHHPRPRQTAHNYTPHTTGIDTLAATIT